jgi:hypothetical protein
MLLRPHREQQSFIEAIGSLIWDCELDVSEAFWWRKNLMSAIGRRELGAGIFKNLGRGTVFPKSACVGKIVKSLN